MSAYIHSTLKVVSGVTVSKVVPRVWMSVWVVVGTVVTREMVGMVRCKWMMRPTWRMKTEGRQTWQWKVWGWRVDRM